MLSPPTQSSPLDSVTTTKQRRPDVLYEFSGRGQDFVDWLKRFKDQGLWVVPLGDDQYQIVEPREWFCPCGKWVADAPQCMHGDVLAPKHERSVQFFNVLLWGVGNVEDFERECAADQKGGMRGW